MDNSLMFAPSQHGNCPNPAPTHQQLLGVEDLMEPLGTSPTTLTLSLMGRFKASTIPQSAKGHQIWLSASTATILLIHHMLQQETSSLLLSIQLNPSPCQLLFVTECLSSWKLLPPPMPSHSTAHLLFQPTTRSSLEKLFALSITLTRVELLDQFLLPLPTPLAATLSFLSTPPLWLLSVLTATTLHPPLPILEI